MSTVFLSEIAAGIGATVRRDGAFGNLGFLTCGTPNRLVAFYDERFASSLAADKGATAVLTTPRLHALVPDGCAVALSDDPLGAFYEAHLLLLERPEFYWSDFPSRISESAQIHPSAQIAGMNVEVGDGAVIHANAVLLPRTIVEPGALVGPGAIIGAEGLQVFSRQGRRAQLPHAGGVLLRKNAVILSASTVDCALFKGFTEIGEDTLIDGKSYIGHNTVIGKRCMITPGVIVGGSVKIGDDTRLGLGAVVSNGVRIGQRAYIPMAEVVAKDIPDDMGVARGVLVPAKRLMDITNEVRFTS
jgi:UDP-3-O-[3-hydroxymyristoyl] glucosamine N-acyltransferase